MGCACKLRTPSLAHLLQAAQAEDLADTKQRDPAPEDAIIHASGAGSQGAVDQQAEAEAPPSDGMAADDGRVAEEEEAAEQQAGEPEPAAAAAEAEAEPDAEPAVEAASPAPAAAGKRGPAPPSPSPTPSSKASLVSAAKSTPKSSSSTPDGIRRQPASGAPRPAVSPLVQAARSSSKPAARAPVSLLAVKPKSSPAKQATTPAAAKPAPREAAVSPPRISPGQMLPPIDPQAAEAGWRMFAPKQAKPKTKVSRGRGQVPGG